MPLAQQLGERLKETRKQKGYTQTQVADIIGQRFQHYMRYEKGIYQLNYEQLVAICKFLDVSSDYLLGLSDY